MKYVCLFLIVIILSFILLKKKENFLSPAVLEIELEENLKKYKKFQKLQQKILDLTKFQIGYKPLENTNKKTIGVCPLGNFFDGEISENISPNNLNKCKECTKCNQGYYLKEGCAGNSNSVCKPEKVPHDIYLGAHGKFKNIHDLINPHLHPYDFSIEPNGKQKFKNSNLYHSHI